MGSGNTDISDKRERMQQHLDRLGVQPLISAPPIWRLPWQSGIDITPPLFMGFWRLFLFMGGMFGVPWGLLTWLLKGWHPGLPAWLPFVIGATTGMLFGLGMAIHFRRLARKYHLPTWQEYAGECT